MYNSTTVSRINPIRGLPGLIARTCLLLLVATAAADADAVFEDAQVVEFENLDFTYAPSAFKLKQAKKLGKTVDVKTEPRVTLTGYLERPPGDEPRPAIVLLHTCAGVSEHDEYWSETLVGWGYVVLTVDSFRPRGIDYVCDGRGQPPPAHEHGQRPFAGRLPRGTRSD